MPIHADKVKGTWETSHFFLTPPQPPKNPLRANSIKLPDELTTYLT